MQARRSRISGEALAGSARCTLGARETDLAQRTDEALRPRVADEADQTRRSGRTWYIFNTCISQRLKTFLFQASFPDIVTDPQ